MSVPIKKAQNLDALNGFSHGFFSRHGGVSSTPYDTLNTGLGSDDEPTRVHENRARCAGALGAVPDHLLTVHQIHSDIAVRVNGPWPGSPTRADGMVTDRPGLALGVLAADCMPFLFADPNAGIIGAAHAGWRGALGGILEATIAAMIKLGADPSYIKGAIGPCLRQPNFEVGLDLYDAFTSKYPQSRRFFAPGCSSEKRQLDLSGFGIWRLNEVGVTDINDIGVCTLTRHEDYFSYRHACQTNQADYGRNLSAIMITKLS